MKKEREIDYSKITVNEYDNTILSVDGFKLDKIEVDENVKEKCNGCIFDVVQDCALNEDIDYCFTDFDDYVENYIYKKQEIKIKYKRKRII